MRLGLTLAQIIVERTWWWWIQKDKCCPQSQRPCTWKRPKTLIIS